ncbi:MAG: DUF4469 domain-containing protein [Opitutales bacterium]|nr:DUF4469 domain-containing protein [Opitutales bacterium]
MGGRAEHPCSAVHLPHRVGLIVLDQPHRPKQTSAERGRIRPTKFTSNPPQPMLKYELVENPLTPNPNDRFARIAKLRSYDMEQVLEQMLRRGTSMSPGDAKLVLDVFVATVKDLVEEGSAVRTPLFNIKPSISGVFEGSDDYYDERRHQIKIHLSTGIALKEAVDEIQTEKVGGNSNQPQVYRVVDAKSQSVNDRITPGGVITVTGKRLKLNPANPEDGAYLISQSTGEETRIDQIIDNVPSRLMLQLPHEMEDGQYALEVRTTYSRGRPTSTLRVGTYSRTLTILSD